MKSNTLYGVGINELFLIYLMLSWGCVGFCTQQYHFLTFCHQETFLACSLCCMFFFLKAQYNQVELNENFQNIRPCLHWFIWHHWYISLKSANHVAALQDERFMQIQVMNFCFHQISEWWESVRNNKHGVNKHRNLKLAWAKPCSNSPQWS